ncbi:MAG: DUF4386 domain-containing protein [Bacteroidales bacterium]|nr:DUF4386 domain-containing protein [Bacteroidales bacterium]
MKIKATKYNAKIAGGLIILGMVTGLLSISPDVDSTDYLTQAAENANQVVFAAVFQFVLALIYLGIALFLFPILTKVSKALTVAFISFRIIATCLMIFGTMLLLSVLSLSQGYVTSSNADMSTLGIIGNMLKHTRDYVNHVFMVLILGASNAILYYLFFKSKFLPLWLPVWGIIGTFLTILASFLILFQIIDVITSEYLILNAPTAVLEIILGIWLIVKGFNKRALIATD